MTNKNKYKQKGGLEPLEITNGNDNKQLTITNVSPPIDKYVPIGRIPYDILIFVVSSYCLFVKFAYRASINLARRTGGK